MEGETGVISLNEYGSVHSGVEHSQWRLLLVSKSPAGDKYHDSRIVAIYALFGYHYIAQIYRNVDGTVHFWCRM